MGPLQGYYQEAGRAGRDGRPSECVLMFAPRDVPRLIQLIRGRGRKSSAKFIRGFDLLKQAQLMLQCSAGAAGPVTLAARTTME